MKYKKNKLKYWWNFKILLEKFYIVLKEWKKVKIPILLINDEKNATNNRWFGRIN